jgi:peptidoglycan hydrolase CwlO-like protein
MTQTRTPLTLPTSDELLLKALEGTDKKVEKLHPLLSLLEEDDTEPYSEIGQALLDALKHIQKELQEFQSLRHDLEKQIEALTASVRDTKATQEIMAKQIEEMHHLLLTPIERP